MKLNIVTPTSRFDFLETIYHSIKSTFKDEWKWYISIDKDNKNVLPILYPEMIILKSENKMFGRDGGSTGRNAAIDVIRDGLVMFLDDDTIMHPNFYKTYTNFINLYPWAVGFTMITAFPNNIPRIIPHPYALNQLYTSCYIFKRDVIGDTRWDLSPCLNDVNFYNKIWSQYAQYIVHMTEIGAFYNYLRPPNEVMS